MPTITVHGGPSYAPGEEPSGVEPAAAPAREVEPDAETDSQPEAVADHADGVTADNLPLTTLPDDLRGASKDAVLAWVDDTDDDSEIVGRAHGALNYERAQSKPRTTLVAELKARLREE